MRLGPSEPVAKCRPREQVDEEVAGDAGAVVAVIAPAEEADRLEGPLGRAAEEAVPIDVGGRGVGRDGILPGADGGVAVEPGFHHVELADGAGLRAARALSDRRAS